MGRRTVENFVDIDIGREGRANKVSRQQVGGEVANQWGMGGGRVG